MANTDDTITTSADTEERTAQDELIVEEDVIVATDTDTDRAEETAEETVHDETEENAEEATEDVTEVDALEESAEATAQAAELTAEEAAANRAEELLKKTMENVDSLNPQIQQMIKRQQEETRRVEKSIEGTKSNPSWYVPLFCFFLVLGLVWVIVYYIKSPYPVPALGAWNLLVGFAILMVGFCMAMWWR